MEWNVPSRTRPIAASYVEHRAGPRVSPAAVMAPMAVKCIDWIKATEETGLILDVSQGGMKLELKRALVHGDALRIDLAELSILAELVYCYPQHGAFRAGIQFKWPLSSEDFAKCVPPEIWSEYVLWPASVDFGRGGDLTKVERQRPMIVLQSCSGSSPWRVPRDRV